MARTTAIQWCDSTVNPVMGCAGCELYVPGKGGPCYAGADHERKGQHSDGFAPEFLLPTVFPGRVAEAARWPDLRGTTRAGKPWLDGTPRLIFVSDMGDALSDAPFGREHEPGRWVMAEDVEVVERRAGKDGRLYPARRLPRAGSVRAGGVPFELLRREVLDVVASASGQRHEWVWLTKRPDRMAALSRWLEAQGVSWPTNLWPGTSVTGSGTVWRAQALTGVGTASTRRVLSVEPLWNRVDLEPLFRAHPGLWWVITGGESRQRKHTAPRPLELAWLRALRDACAACAVPLFVKQLGGAPREGGTALRLCDAKHGGEWEEWPQDLRLRARPDGAHRREAELVRG
mgnify:CR=1 FL=1